MPSAMVRRIIFAVTNVGSNFWLPLRSLIAEEEALEKGMEENSRECAEQENKNCAAPPAG